MSEISTAVDVLFDDPEMAVDGTFLAGGVGPGVACRLMPERNDPRVQFSGYEGTARSPGAKVLLRKLDVPARPSRKNEDRLIVGAGPIVGNYPVQDAADDVDGLWWIVDLGKAT